MISHLIEHGFLIELCVLGSLCISSLCTSSKASFYFLHACLSPLSPVQFEDSLIELLLYILFFLVPKFVTLFVSLPFCYESIHSFRIHKSQIKNLRHAILHPLLLDRCGRRTRGQQCRAESRIFCIWCCQRRGESFWLRTQWVSAHHRTMVTYIEFRILLT